MQHKPYKKVKVDDVLYEITPPDGGWGYLVALSTTIIYISTVVPIAGFGIVFKDFFATLGDNTTGITLTNSIFNTVSFFMGLVANVLLLKTTYRKVALLGSLLHIIGTTGAIFITNLPLSITFVGVFQGMGFGLLLPSALTAFNEYFSKNLQLWMTISQSGMAIGYMIMPSIETWAMQYFGFRGTLVGLMALSLLTIPAALSFQPVKWHMKLSKLNSDIEMLEKLDVNESGTESKDENNLAENAAEIEESACKMKCSSMMLLKDLKYINICLGLALCFTADILFYPIIPLVLDHMGFPASDIATIMSVYFGADLVARIGLSLLSIFISYKSRTLFYWGALLCACFRIAWTLNNTFWWRIITMGILGILRCFIETLIPLVISEEYPKTFSSAYTLYMVANGCTCLLLGTTMSYARSYTNNDAITCHILTAAFLLSVILWTLERLIGRKKK